MTFDYDETVGYAGCTNKFFQYIQIEMDAANKEHQVIFNISMMYYHLYPVMLIAGFPVVKPADMYSVAHPIVWAVLLDYVLFIFKKTAEGKDLNIKYFSQEFQNISEEAYGGFRQIVAAAEPHEIMDIYRDALVVKKEAMVGGGEGNLFNMMFPGQSGGGGAGGPNGPDVTNTTLGAPAASAVSTAVAERRAALNARFQKEQLDELETVYTPKYVTLVRAELQALVTSIQEDIAHVNGEEGATLSPFGQRLEAAINTAVEASDLGGQLSTHARSLSPYWGPCGVVCETFAKKYVSLATLAGVGVVTQTKIVDYVKQMLVDSVKQTLGADPTPEPEPKTGWISSIPSLPSVGDMISWSSTSVRDMISGTSSWVVGTTTGTISAAINGAISGVTGLQVTIPGVLGSLACVAGATVIVHTTIETIKVSNKTRRTRAAELNFLNKIKKDAFLAALQHVRRVIMTTVDRAEGLLDSHGQKYMEEILKLRLPRNYSDKLQKLKDDNPHINVTAAPRILKIKELAKLHAEQIMNRISTDWTVYDWNRILGLIDDDKKEGYKRLSKELAAMNEKLAFEIGEFNGALQAIAQAPINAAGTAARALGTFASLGIAAGIAAAVPQTAPAAIGYGLNALSGSAAAGAGSSAAGVSGPPRLGIGNGSVSLLGRVGGLLQLENAPQSTGGCPVLRTGTRGGRRTIRRHRKNRNSHRRRRSSHRRR